MEQLLTRLTKGSSWLHDANEQLLAMEYIGRGTELEIAFLDAIDLWDNLDMALRNTYSDYRGCVLDGKTCAGDAPVRCRWCGNSQAHGEKEGGYEKNIYGSRTRVPPQDY